MNVAMVDNWNETVRDEDVVYFVGDLGSTKKHPTRFWLEKLRGRIHFIKGNHDDSSVVSVPHLVLEHHGIEFYLTHYPENVPNGWRGWVIHGHKHNNDLENFPLINGTRRTINVSVELIGYRPVDLDKVVENIEQIRRKTTLDSVAELL